MDMKAISSKERVMKALNFQEPDRLPRWDAFWPEFQEVWRRQKGFGREVDPIEYYDVDFVVVVADETAWPTKAEILGGDTLGYRERTGWGAVHRSTVGAAFYEEVEPGLDQRVDPDKLVFDDPLMDSRYEAAGEEAEKYKAQNRAVFCKTGGPYLRAATVRGMENFLMDIAEDPVWTKAFVDRLMDHMTQIGIEQIKRFGLQSTGIGIFDDCCSNHGLLMGRKAYEKLFYPSLQKMVKAYKDAGAAKVFTHCDGKDEEVLELWVDAGVDATHPLEARTGMDPIKIQQKFEGKLAIIGGLDNCDILPRGDRDEVKRHVLHLIEAGRGGGLVMAPHSIGGDVTVETYEYVQKLLGEYGEYPPFDASAGRA